MYEPSREVIEFRTAVKSLTGMLGDLFWGSERYKVNHGPQRHLRGVQAHAILARACSRTRSC